jgi:hypothetical protein
LLAGGVPTKSTLCGPINLQEIAQVEMSVRDFDRLWYEKWEKKWNQQWTIWENSWIV